MPCNDLMDINATTISTYFHKQEKRAITYKPTINAIPSNHANKYKYNKSKKSLIFANEKQRILIY